MESSKTDILDGGEMENMHNKLQLIQNLLIIFVTIVFVYTFVAFFVIQKDAKNVYDINEAQVQNVAESIRVGIVFGGGVTDSQPLPLVRDRLDVAKDLLDRGYVYKLIVSGDNRALDYNEPTVMRNYLVNELGVAASDVQEDFAGRSTYETCDRAKKIFGLNTAFLISESTHLPRAIYLCRHFGIKAYGIKSDGQASRGPKIGQRWRELLARNKALFNTNVYGEQTVLGDPIKID